MSHGPFDHLASSRRHWWLVVASGVSTLAFGGIGEWQYASLYSAYDHGLGARALSSIYTALQMLVLHTPHFEHPTNLWLEIGRWMGVFTLGTTTILVFWTRVRREVRWMRHRHLTGHTVVCGVGERGMGIVRFLRRPDRAVPVIAIDPNPDPRHAAECDRLGVCLIFGDATNSTVLAEAGVPRAKEVIVITPTDDINVRVGLEIQDLGGTAGFAPPRCLVHLADINLREILQRQHPAGTVLERRGAPQFFDVFAHEARRTLLALPIDGDGITAADSQSVHVVILGFGRMGRSVALSAAKLGHFANGKRLRITAIGREATAQQEGLLFRYPALGNDSICRLQFVTAEAESLTTRQLLEKFAAEPDTLLHVFICADEDTRAMELALRAREILTQRPGTNLIVRLKSQESLDAIARSSSATWPHVCGFGMVENACEEGAYRNEVNAELAQCNHERFIAQFSPDNPRVVSGDESLRPWAELHEENRDSNRQKADHLWIKLRAIGCGIAPAKTSSDAAVAFSDREIETLAKMEHVRWSAEQLLAGWLYGDQADTDRRVIPQLVPWDKLREPVREDYKRMVRGIPELIAAARPNDMVVRLR